MKKCKHCGIDFEPKNPKGKFCSDKCRVYNNRTVKQPIKIDYTPPMITTSAANIEKVNQIIDDVLKDPIRKKLEEYETELTTVPDAGLGKKRRIFLQSKISELKRQLK